MLVYRHSCGSSESYSMSKGNRKTLTTPMHVAALAALATQPGLFTAAPSPPPYTYDKPSICIRIPHGCYHHELHTAHRVDLPSHCSAPRMQGLLPRRRRQPCSPYICTLQNISLLLASYQCIRHSERSSTSAPPRSCRSYMNCRSADKVRPAGR